MSEVQGTSDALLSNAEKPRLLMPTGDPELVNQRPGMDVITNVAPTPVNPNESGNAANAIGSLLGAVQSNWTGGSTISVLLLGADSAVTANVEVQGSGSRPYVVSGDVFPVEFDGTTYTIKFTPSSDSVGKTVFAWIPKSAFVRSLDNEATQEAFVGEWMWYRLCDGGAVHIPNHGFDTNLNGVTVDDAQKKVIVGADYDPAGDADYNSWAGPGATPNSSGGSKTHGHSNHTAADIGDHTVEVDKHSADVTGSDGGHDHDVSLPQDANYEAPGANPVSGIDVTASASNPIVFTGAALAVGNHTHTTPELTHELGGSSSLTLTHSILTHSSADNLDPYITRATLIKVA